MPDYEKIICCDRDNNEGLYAALMNGNNNQWNNPFVYLVWMSMFRQWNNNGCNDGNGCYNAQLASIQNQMQDNQNSNLLMDAVRGNTNAIADLANRLNCDFNTLNGAICDVRNGIEKVSGQVGFSAERVINAVAMGNCNIIQAVKDCCCSTQKEIMQVNYDLRNGQRDLGAAISQGFSASAYETQKQTCDILRAGEINTQRIIDTLNTHWKDEQADKIQDLKFQLSQERQNNYFARLINGNGCGNGCGNCGNGCNGGF